MARRLFRLVIAGGCLAAGPEGVRSQTFDVKTPEVKAGSLDFDLDNTRQARVRERDIPAGAHDLSLNWGVTDWWRLSGYVKLEDPAEASLRVHRVAVESVFVLRPIGSGPSPSLGFGWFTAVDAAVDSDATNALTFGPIATIKFDKLSFTANPFLEQTFGQNRIDGIALNYAWQVKHEISTGLAVGIEGFGLIQNLANPPSWVEQEHRIGPVVYLEIALTKDLTITPDIGLLFGLTPATPDVAFKINVGVPLRLP